MNLKKSLMMTVLTGPCLIVASGTWATASIAATNPSGTITVAAVEGLFSCGFSPFNPSSNFLSFGLIYEPLMFVDELQNGKTSPWLADSYVWGEGNKSVTFSLRQGITWSDGQQFSAKDVVFTFNLLKKYPSLDLNAVWSVLSSVTSSAQDQITFTFKTAAVPYFYYIADQVGIVPQHIWGKVNDPTTFQDAAPVGTGAFTIAHCTPQDVSYTRNENYWQPGLPRISRIEFPAYTSNPPANLLLSTGGSQWGSDYIPNVQREYLSKSPDNHYWGPATSNVAIFINRNAGALKDLAVRQAMSIAIDRPRVALIGESDLELAANQSGIVVPAFDTWLDKAQFKQYDYSYNPKRATDLLEKAGYKRGADGIFESPDGKPLSLGIINVAGYNDWVASVYVLTQQLLAIGIKLNVENLASSDYNTRLFNGDFDLAYAYETGGPTPYYEFRQWLYSGNSAPFGQPASTNWERYSDKATDMLLDRYAATTSVDEQLAIISKLQNVLLRDVPLIPVTQNAFMTEYSTKQFGGFPTAADPYASGMPVFEIPDWGYVALHLYEKK
jgi:peptide/nickel transport system substrate-binding protein